MSCAMSISILDSHPQKSSFVMLKVVCESAHMKIFTNILFSCFSSTQILCRYDQLSDGLEDVFVDKKMNTQITLEDEDALDPIDDI